MSNRLIIKAAITTTAVACCLSCSVGAVEKFSAYEPGATTRSPTGSLPPPGMYITDDFYVARGTSFVDSSGKGIPITVQNIVNVPTLLWVPGWSLLGAQYGAIVLQPYAEHDLDTSAIGGKTSKSAGFFNTVVTPAILSWNLGHGLFTSAGVTVYLPDGQHRYENGRPAPTSYANDYWTVEPNFAISYLVGGWNFTINNVLDFNRTNPTTNYHSGAAYYMDATATRRLDHGLSV